MKTLLTACFMLLLTALNGSVSAQVVISELMIDPTPPVQLPNAEYIELFNDGNSAVSLRGWSMQVGNSRVVLPDCKIESQAYLLLTDVALSSEFSQYGAVCAISHFPALANTGATVCLRSSEGKVVYTLQYTTAWYGVKEKASGGWSIEMKDVHNHCANVAENYCASANPRGGSPAQANTPTSTLVEVRAVKPELVWVENDSQIMIQFNRPLDSAMLSAIGNYHFLEQNIAPRRVTTAGVPFNQVQITTRQRLRKNQIEHLQIQMVACETSTVQLLTVAVALPDLAVAGTVVINELLFDASSTGEEFVELYNNSSRVIDLKDVSITVLDSSAARGTVYNFSKQGMLFFPGEYCAFSKDTSAVRNSYPVTSVGRLCEIALPTLPNAGATVQLLGKDSVPLESVSYNDAMHYPLLHDPKGVSLERISPSVLASDSENWHSAAQSCGFATPGRVNSQHVASKATNQTVQLIPESISPDNDGVDDVGQIVFSLQRAGFLATVTLYDLAGNRVRTLANSLLLATTNDRLVWDATDNSNSLLPNAAYICLISLIHPDGETLSYKLPWYIARRP